MALTVGPDALGTSEAAWQDHAPLAACKPIDTARSFFGAGRAGRVVVVAPHPDDEVLGAGGAMHRLARDGHFITVVAVTDGEASHPRSTRVTPKGLADMRAHEREMALARLGPRVLAASSVVRLGVPDGGVAEDASLANVLTHHVEGATLCIAPWERDGHPDHDAAGEAARVACARVGVPLLRYLIWAWHWARPASADIPWERARKLSLSPEERVAKADAISAFHSQIRPLGPSDADGPVLPAGVLARFHRPFEIFLE